MLCYLLPHRRRTARQEEENLVYWQTVAAQLDSMRALPGSSTRAGELGEAVQLLHEVLEDFADADQQLLADVATIDRRGE